MSHATSDSDNTLHACTVLLRWLPLQAGCMSSLSRLALRVCYGRCNSSGCAHGSAPAPVQAAEQQRDLELEQGQQEEGSAQQQQAAAGRTVCRQQRRQQQRSSGYRRRSSGGCRFDGSSSRASGWVVRVRVRER